MFCSLRISARVFKAPPRHARITALLATRVCGDSASRIAQHEACFLVASFLVLVADSATTRVSIVLVCLASHFLTTLSSSYSQCAETRNSLGTKGARCSLGHPV
eukprot:6749462-Pyramimonas_sp.AAC.1